MPRLPHISVLMPTFNQACYLPEAIQSILNQTYSNFEFIILDDGSTDETPSILARFARQDQRIRLLCHETNIGRAGARNQILQSKPRGEFWAMMDSDDIALPERFEQQIAEFANRPDLVALGAQVQNIDEYNNPTPEQTRLPETHGALAWTLTYSVPFCNPVVMMRAQAALQLGGYEAGSAVEDAEFWSRLVYTGRFANLSQILLHYRMPSARLVKRLADWALPLRNVIQRFVEKLIEEPLSSHASEYLYRSLFFDANFHFTAPEAFQAMRLIQRLFETMQTKKLLYADDVPEVADLILNQYQLLIRYTQSDNSRLSNVKVSET